MMKLSIAGAFLVMAAGAAGMPSAGNEFQTRIDEAAKAGGGVVTVPTGRYVTGGLLLRSNVELRLERGAVLEGSPCTNDYPVAELPCSEGRWMAVVMAVGQTNVSVTGEGEIFGNGRAFPQPEDYGNMQEGWRPRGLFFGNCRGVRLNGFTLRDSGSWGCVVQRCTDVEIRGLTIDNHANANNDGIDLEAFNAVIADCDIDAGDDAVCLKSNDPDFVSGNILVSNVTARSYCAVLKIGTATHGICTNVLFTDIRIAAPRRDFPDLRPSADKPMGSGWFCSKWRADIFPPARSDERMGLSAIAIECVDGGWVEDVTCRNIVIDGGVAEAFFVRGGTRSRRSTGASPGCWHILRNVLFENVSGRVVSCVGNAITGVEGCRVGNVTLKNVDLQFQGGGDMSRWVSRRIPELADSCPGVSMFEGPLPGYAIWARHVDGLKLENVSIRPQKGSSDCREPVALEDVTGVGETRTVKMLTGEEWRGAANAFGSQMPFDGASGLTIDLRKSNYSNQYASLLLSNRGRVIWSDRQAAFTITNGTITVSSDGPVTVAEAGKTLRDAFLFASKTYFPPSGRTPDLTFFAAPQYNTWIEFTYNQNEKDILAYAQSMLDNGFPPGVLMIDDTWQTAYGEWHFDGRRFSDPKGMVKKLHDQGFKVILWICPWVSMDSPAYRLLTRGIDPFKEGRFPQGGLYRGANGNVTPVEWWNGVSAMLDFTDPRGREWFKGELDRLVTDYGVDGFKLDGGALPHYPDLTPFERGTPSAEQANGFAAFSLQYPVCEYRHAWNYGGKPVVMRLQDKHHRWRDMEKLIPDLIAGGLLGCQFMCPDMVGGGDYVSFLPGSPFEEELFIRSAQVHALCGQMQFSASPWRVLSPAGQKIIRDLVRMRQEKFAAKFVELAKECGRTGEPMIRHMDYMFPGNGYGKIRDQFVMGDFLMVAPQVEKGAPTREVSIPPGKWVADDGTVVTGPNRITVKTPLSRLPYFELEQ